MTDDIFWCRMKLAIAEFCLESEKSSCIIALDSVGRSIDLDLGWCGIEAVSFLAGRCLELEDNSIKLQRENDELFLKNNSSRLNDIPPKINLNSDLMINLLAKNRDRKMNVNMPISAVRHDNAINSLSNHTTNNVYHDNQREHTANERNSTENSKHLLVSDYVIPSTILETTFTNNVVSQNSAQKTRKSKALRTLWEPKENINIFENFNTSISIEKLKLIRASKDTTGL